MTLPKEMGERGKLGADVCAQQLVELVEQYRTQIKVLSLDCFDTLLWRKTARPADVFFSMQQSIAFRSRDFVARLRARAEGDARNLQLSRHGSGEVKLVDIYRAAFGELTDAELESLARAELDAEIAACYAFPDTVAMIRAAKAVNLSVVIVSDTYFTQHQLRELLSSALPADVYAAIDRVYCSSEYGASKSNGLFPRILPSFRVKPKQVLHVGDNEWADFKAPRSVGLHAVKLVQFAPAANEVLRLGHVAQTLCLPSVWDTSPLESPFRGVFARDSKPETPAHVLGYLGMGPLIYSFARFVIDEIAQLEREKGRVKSLFLLRDAYLPQLACSVLAGASFGHSVAMGRFVAYAAAFSTASDVQDYVARSAGGDRLDAVCRQLLLPEKLTAELIAQAKRDPNPKMKFVHLVQDEAVLKVIFEQSKAYRTRLFRYLSNAIDLREGDTLVFVDLGYEGTAQRQLEPLFLREMNVTVTGRYLLASRVFNWQKSRCGLIDPSFCDDRTLATLCHNISILESLCTSDTASVVDFTNEGEPVGAERVIDAAQFERVKPVQEECLAFVRDAAEFFASTGTPPSRNVLRAASVGALGRLLYLPTETELTYLEGFRIDMNLATTDSVPLFDIEQGFNGLRRRGLLLTEQTSRKMHTNYPFELRAAGLEMSLTSFAQQRFALELTKRDLSLRYEVVTILVMKSGASTHCDVQAKATYDGYFALEFPLGAGDLNLGVLFGQKYRWLQIDSVETIQTSALYSEDESEHTEDASSQVSLDGIVQQEPGLFQCQNESGFLLVRASRINSKDGSGAVCRIVYRPVVARTS